MEHREGRHRSVRGNLKEGEWWTEYYWYTHKNGGNGCILLTSYDFKTAASK